jgi:LDH2 family malate/lactate/ureidoglycolate dehydrogenase
LTLASHLLWFDAAGAASLGIATFPSWLDAIEAGRVDPAALGKVVGERAAMVTFNAQNGIPALGLERAAELAITTAREMTVGLVRVAQVGRVGSAAPVTAGIALGPMAGFALGPNGLWSIALPSASGLPFVVDAGMAAVEGVGKPGSPRVKADSPKSQAPPGLTAVFDGLALGAEILLVGGSWLIAAVSIPALEPLTTFQERVGAALEGLASTPGQLLPTTWDAHRREIQEHGVPIAPGAWKSLNHWAHRLGVEVPKSIGD